MSYIDFINQFWQKDLEFNFSDKEIALYFYLLKVSNSIGWKNPFGLSNALTIAKFNWGRSSFDTAKNNLKKAGLIDFKQGDGRGNVYQYELKVPVKVNEKGVQKSTLSPHLSDHLSPHLSRQKPTTSIEEDKEEDTTNKTISSKPEKKFLKIQENLKITEDEDNSLVKDVGRETTDKCYQFLSDYKKEKPYKTKSDYLSIRRWVIDAVKKQTTPTTNGKHQTSIVKAIPVGGRSKL